MTTGTCIVPMAIAAGDTVTIDYGELGSISCRVRDMRQLAVSP